jgi:hypothetical protein
MEAGVGILKALLRLFSYFFEGLLALVLLVISLLSIVTGAELNLGFLPWKGMALSHWLLALALVGLITLLMALAGKLRWLFLLWCLAVFVLLVRGLLLSSQRFAPPVTFKTAAYLLAASFLGMIGSWPWARRREPVRRPMKW